MSSIAENLEGVRGRINTAAQSAGRDPASIKLVCVSKTKTPAEIREAYTAGQRAFGENYAQELKEKAEALADLNIEWHFIGHLQKNKAKIVAPIASFVEGVDSLELAVALDKRACGKLPCLIEVNIGAEESKGGTAVERIIPLAKEMLTLPNLDLRGLMAIPPYDPDPEKSRPYFKQLKSLLDALNAELKLESPLCGLSMGMSHDFEAAIEEGATIIRVGTAIFGERF